MTGTGGDASLRSLTTNILKCGHKILLLENVTEVLSGRGANLTSDFGPCGAVSAPVISSTEIRF